MVLTLIRAIIDTNVLFEGLTKQGGACGLIIDAWLKGLFTACISTAVEYEYADVLQRKLSPSRWQQIQPVLALLLAQAEWTKIYYSWRPTSPDAGDDLVIDCAMNAGAIVVTFNRKDFLSAEQNLGLRVMSPVEFVEFLTAELSKQEIII